MFGFILFSGFKTRGAYLGPSWTNTSNSHEVIVPPEEVDALSVLSFLHFWQKCLCDQRLNLTDEQVKTKPASQSACCPTGSVFPAISPNCCPSIRCDSAKSSWNLEGPLPLLAKIAQSIKPQSGCGVPNASLQRWELGCVFRLEAMLLTLQGRTTFKENNKHFELYKINS